MHFEDVDYSFEIVSGKDKPKVCRGGLNVRGKLGALNNLSILLGGGAQMTNGTPFTGRGFVLFKTVVSSGVPTAIGGQGVSLWTGIAIGVGIIIKVFCIVARAY